MKFEDTKLLDHPEVRKAFNIASGIFSKPSKKDFLDNSVHSGEFLSQHLTNKDPHVIAAAVIVPFVAQMNVDALHFTQAEKDMIMLVSEKTVTYALGSLTSHHLIGQFPKEKKLDKVVAEIALANLISMVDDVLDPNKLAKAGWGTSPSAQQAMKTHFQAEASRFIKHTSDPSLEKEALKYLERLNSNAGHTIPTSSPAPKKGKP